MRKRLALYVGMEQKDAQKGLDQLRQKVQRVSASVTKTMMVAGAAVAALGAAFVAVSRNVLQAGAQMEGYRIQLETLYGSAKQAGEMLQWIVAWAAKTPFEIPNILETTIMLRSVGMEAKSVMGIIGDTAAAMGRDIGEVGTALISMEREVLRRYGIDVRREQDQATFLWTDAQGKIVKTVAEGSDAVLRETLLSIWNQRYAGGMEKFQVTWRGMWSNLMDALFRFRVMIAEAGIFDAFKEDIRAVLDWLGRLEKEGKLQQWALGISDALKDVHDRVKEWILESGVQYLESLKRVAAAMWDLGKAVGGLALTIAANRALIIGFFTSFILLMAADKVLAFAASLKILKGATALGGTTAALGGTTTALKGATVAVGGFGGAVGVALAALAVGAPLGLFYMATKDLIKMEDKLKEIKTVLDLFPPQKDIRLSIVMDKESEDRMKMWTFMMETITVTPAKTAGVPIPVPLGPQRALPLALPESVWTARRRAAIEEEERMRGGVAGAEGFWKPGFIPEARRIPMAPPPVRMPAVPLGEEEVRREVEEWREKEQERERVRQIQTIEANQVILNSFIGMYQGIGQASEKFFRGDLKNARQWGAAYEMIGRSVAASVIHSIGDMLSAKALDWAAEGFAALGKSLGWNPFTAAAGAGMYFKAAALAGVGAGVAYGAAGAIRGAGEEHYGGAFGGGGAGAEAGRAGGGRREYGAAVRATPQNIFIQPSVTISGDTIIIGRTGVDELKETMGAAVVEATKDALETGEIDLRQY